ncbi:MAG: nuclear transport factor 2 family protein [Bryobacteraceae bacterium]
MKNRWTFSIIAAATAGVISLAALGAQSRSMPARKRQATPERVVEEHLAAFNACDSNRLMAQFPDNVEFFSPHGAVVRGRKALGDMFAKVVKPPSEGGTCGLKITAEHKFVVGETVNVQWRAEAPFLAEPYRGADAYETHDGLMAAQVTTFNQSELKMKVAEGR